MVPCIIGVCGGSCSGKTSSSRKIMENFESLGKKIALITQDSYYFSGNKDTNFDIPESIDFALLIFHLNELINGRSVEVPNYNFKTHSREIETTRVDPCNIIIVEGILIFAIDKLYKMFDLKVYVDAYPEIMIFRRLKRDVDERGRTIDEVREQYLKTVLPAYHLFVVPCIGRADIVLVNNEENSFVCLKILFNHINAILNC